MLGPLMVLQQVLSLSYCHQLYALPLIGSALCLAPAPSLCLLPLLVLCCSLSILLESLPTKCSP